MHEGDRHIEKIREKKYQLSEDCKKTALKFN